MKGGVIPSAPPSAPAPSPNYPPAPPRTCCRYAGCTDTRALNYDLDQWKAFVTAMHIFDALTWNKLHVHKWTSSALREATSSLGRTTRRARLCGRLLCRKLCRFCADFCINCAGFCAALFPLLR